MNILRIPYSFLRDIKKIKLSISGMVAIHLCYILIISCIPYNWQSLGIYTLVLVTVRVPCAPNIDNCHCSYNHPVVKKNAAMEKKDYDLDRTAIKLCQTV